MVPPRRLGAHGEGLGLLVGDGGDEVAVLADGRAPAVEGDGEEADHVPELRGELVQPDGRGDPVRGRLLLLVLIGRRALLEGDVLERGERLVELVGDGPEVREVHQHQQPDDDDGEGGHRGADEAPAELFQHVPPSRA